MNPMKLKTSVLHGIRVGCDVGTCQVPMVNHRGMEGKPAHSPSSPRDPRRACQRQDFLRQDRGTPYRRRLAILPRQTILSRWSLAAGPSCLEATQGSGANFTRAELFSGWERPSTGYSAGLRRR